jgi:hypothetical protein
MIRKIAIGAGIAAVLVLLAVLILNRPTGPSDAASLAPADTILFINFPNLPRTALRWNGTALSKIAQEPEMKTFLEKPLARLNSNAGAGEASAHLLALKPGNIFFALTGLSDSGANGVVGFQYWGGRDAFEKAVARMRKAALGENAPLAKETFDGVEIVTAGSPGSAICSATLGNWGFLASNPELIKAALNRASGKSRDALLSENETFKTVASKLNADPDLRAFLRLERIVDVLVGVGRKAGAQPIPAQIEALKSAEAVGATWKLDGLIQRDAIYILRRNAAPTPEFGHIVTSLTSPDSIGLVELSLHLDSLTAFLRSAAPDLTAPPDVSAVIDSGRDAYGPEAGIILNWPPGQITPTPLIAVQIRDREKAAQFLSGLLKIVPNPSVNQWNGLSLYSIPTFGNPLAAPTFAQTDNFLLLGPDVQSVQNAASRPPGAPTLEASPAFQASAPFFKEANEAFAYIDTKAVFERAYTALRPVIIFGAAMMPDIYAVVDTTRLPQTETVAKHLSPMLLSQVSSPDGTLIQSSGPITLNQAVLLGMISAGSAGQTFLAR